MPALSARLRALYSGHKPLSRRFRQGLLAFDLVVLSVVAAGSFIARTPTLEWIDMAFRVVIFCDLAARLLADWRHIFRISSLADAILVLFPFMTIDGQGLGFLRVFNTLRVVHTPAFLDDARNRSAFFRRNEEAVLAMANLAAFMLVMTGFVYVTQNATHPDIRHYADALYFTVAALTTTGFGDITLPGLVGRMTSVVIMIFGVTLFLRLAQILIRPSKVRFACPSCALLRHEPDAVHCKACGTLLKIPDEGVD